MTTDADRIRVQHMLEAASEAVEFIGEKSVQHLKQDRQLALSLVKEIEIIGEAASQVSAAFRQHHAHIPWELIIGMRHRLVHGYFSVDLDIVWNTVTIELPRLIGQLEEVV